MKPNAAEAAAVWRNVNAKLPLPKWADADVKAGAVYCLWLRDELAVLGAFDTVRLACDLVQAMCRVEGEHRGILPQVEPEDAPPW